jgi:hypothetical protein
MRNTQLMTAFALSMLVGGTVITACNPVRMTTNAVGLTKKDIESGEKIHLKVPPEQALKILDDVAAQNGWSIVSVGDQYDMQGLRGKYYRMETSRFIGGRKTMSGVFFNEPTGCFTVVGKNDSGLPTELVEPFLAATNGHVGSAKLEPDTSEPK